MATKVYNTEEVVLQDETEVTLKPLPIGRLRRFMDAWGKIGELEEGDDGFDVFINCAGIALEENFKGKFDALKATAEEKDKGEYLAEDYKEYLMDTLDIDTIYKILEVAGGIKLNDPKLMEALSGASGTGWEEVDLAGLEGEAMLIGIWKNIEELEESINLPELEAIVIGRAQAEA